jgi:hypothetical protein
VAEEAVAEEATEAGVAEVVVQMVAMAVTGIIVPHLFAHQLIH